MIKIKYGLEIYSKGDKKNLVVFIHGLFGDKKTWKNSEGKFIYEVMYSIEELNNDFDFGYFIYKTNFFYNILTFLKKEILTIEEIAEVFKTELETKSKNYENIILIGHSMGGLVIKKYILNNLDNKKIKLYISIAVPHQGSAIANFIKLNHPQIGQLKKNTKILEKLSSDWVKKEEEVPETFYFRGAKDQIVPENSAIPELFTDKTKIKTFYSDHFDIVKGSKDSLMIQALKDILITFSLKTKEKIIIKNLSKSHMDTKIVEEIHLKEGYSIFDSLKKMKRDEIFHVIAGEANELKNRDLLEEYIKNHQKELSKTIESAKEICYLAKGHIPLIFLEGYLSKKVSKIKYFVNFRENNKILELQTGQYNEQLDETIVSDIVEISDSFEVSIAISWSFEIAISDVKNFKPGITILEFRRKLIAPDCITHYKQLEKIGDDLIFYIRALQNKKNVKKINIFAAVPVPLAFYLGIKIEQHDPQIIVYNKVGSDYDWGLDIKTGKIIN